MKHYYVVVYGDDILDQTICRDDYPSISDVNIFRTICGSMLNGYSDYDIALCMTIQQNKNVSCHILKFEGPNPIIDQFFKLYDKAKIVKNTLKWVNIQPIY